MSHWCYTTPLYPGVVACAAGVVFAPTFPPQPAFLARLVCLEQGGSSSGLYCSNGCFLTLAAEELIGFRSLILFLLIGHLWLLFKIIFSCFLSWVFWLIVLKYETNTKKASASRLGLHWESKVISSVKRKKGWKRRRSFSGRVEE